MNVDLKNRLEEIAATALVKRWRRSIFAEQLNHVKKKLAVKFPTAPEEFLEKEAKKLLYRVSN